MPIPWADQLSVLADLQKLDSRIYFLERELARTPDRKKTLEASFEAKKKDFKAAEQALKEIQLKQKERENELLTKETKIKTYQTQQLQVKTNKEYSALTHEINALKADCSMFEEEILRLMDQIESQKRAVDAEKKKLENEEKSMKQECAALDQGAQAAKKDLEGLVQERVKFLPSVDKSVLGQYERLVKKKEGAGISRLIGYTCSGCSMNLTPQAVNEIRLKEKMITCESCGRILYE